MSKVPLLTVATVDNSLIANINTNSTTITTAFDNTLSRDGTSPNQMNSVIDMNNHTIINLPNAVSSTQPVTLGQLANVPSNSITLSGDATGNWNSGTGILPVTLNTVNGSAGTFGDASHYATVTVNSKGLVTSASSLTLPNLPTINLSGDGTGNWDQVSNLPLTLNSVNSGVGTWGDSTHTPVITVNAKGLVTAASQVSSSGGGGTLQPSLPQLRLTLSSNNPVMPSSVTGATSVFYTPYVGQQVPLFDGTNIGMNDVGGQLSQTLADTTKSPAAAVASSVYDMFVWNDGGTFRCTRGPAWTNTTTRSAGTALSRTKGVLLNTLAITNGPAASRGTYVGTITTNGSGTCDYIPTSISSNGAFIDVWNMYNRVNIGLSSTAGIAYTYSTNTIRSTNNTNGDNRITIVIGIVEDYVNVAYFTSATTPGIASSAYTTGFGINSTSAFSNSGKMGDPSTNVVQAYINISGVLLPAIGVTFYQALEQGDGTNPFTIGANVSRTITSFGRY